jgi:hypothetical protein
LVHFADEAWPGFVVRDFTADDVVASLWNVAEYSHGEGALLLGLFVPVESFLHVPKLGKQVEYCVGREILLDLSAILLCSSYH